MTDSKNIEEKSINEIFGSQKVKLYKIKHFLFDFGGVMIQKTFAFKNLCDLIREDLNVQIEFEKESFFRKNRRKLSSGLITAREFLECIIDFCYSPDYKKDCELPPKEINIEYYLELWFHLYSQFTHLSSKMEEIVTRLHQAGFIVSLVSNTFAIHAKSNELKGFFNLFDHVFLSNEIGLIKPDKKKYLHVLKKLKAKPKNCVFIDDKLRNLVTAREVGITVIRFESIEKFIKQLSELGIEEISENLRQDIRDQYEQYELKKKDYKSAKKKYKKAKKKKNTLKRKINYKAKKSKYEKKKRQYKEEKQVKKSELEKKLKLS